MSKRERRPRRVVILIFDGLQSLDATGPLEVFALADLERRQADSNASPAYAVEVVAPAAGPVTAHSGLRLIAERACRAVGPGVDTLIVAGGDVRAIAADRVVRRWLVACSRRVRRLASVCTGAFVLAEAGLLDGRRATTHWRAAEDLARRFPRVSVEPDAIFVRDGRIWTSAGVTAGIDMALAMVAEDLGHALALAVARRMVVFLKRPGGQSQFSSHLAAQTPAPGRLRDLPAWIVDHLGADLAVERLAERVAMSPRTFARVFHRETGVTPAKFVERARLDAARRLLEDEGLGLDEVASRAGFASAEQMRRTFRRHLRVLPFDYRKRFRRDAAASAAATPPPRRRLA
ncbi:MAG TPA: GlxA family transcriptional regulator [Candidatus Dormibacteraeota bacterium]|nr:GlxA family transcriptional regulator [Candidatus Dormibacteraeota bacterium]